MNIEELNERNPINIGYYDPFNVLPLISKDLDKHFPLSNLHLKLDSKQPTKTINQLSINFISEVPKTTHHQIKSDYEVYSRIMFIKVESLDKYRSQVRPLIREWLKHLVFKYKNSWMLVLYCLDLKETSNSIIIKTSFFDKLQKDFGVEGKELTTISPNSNSDQQSQHCFKYKSKTDEVEFISILKRMITTSLLKRYDTLVDWMSQQKSNSLEKFIAVYKLGLLLNEMKLFQESYDTFEQSRLELDKSVSSDSDTKYNLDIKIDTIDVNKFEQIDLNDTVFNEGDINLFQLRCMVFVNQSLTLQYLAINSSSKSLGAKHFCKLYQNLMIFLNLIQTSNKNKIALAELEYKLIEYYLHLPILENFINEELKELLECRADLKLFQRSVITKIAELNGIYISQLEFEDVSINETLTDKPNFPGSLFKNKQEYLDKFEKLTEDIIQDYVICQRTKSIDILSIDLALLNFDKKNYQQCLDILQDSHDFFINNSWNFLGGVLLEFYLKCIEHTRIDNDQDEEILKTCIKLFSILNSSSSNNLNSMRLVKNKDQVVGIYEKIDQYSSSLTQPMEIPLNDFFQSNLFPYIYPNNDISLDQYVIDLKMSNSYEMQFHIPKIELIIINDEGYEIKFHTSNVELGFKSSVFKLFSNHFILGSFAPYKLIVFLNENLKLILKYGEKELQMNHASFNDDTVVHNSTTIESQLDNNQLLTYQCLNKFRANFQCSNKIKLDRSEVLLKINNGNNQINNVSINLSSTTTNLQLDNSVVNLEKLDANEEKNIHVPYKYESDNKLINVRARIKYHIEQEEYVFEVSYNIDTSLTISVSVQDIFKSDFIYSKFQIGTSNSKFPIRILNNELKNENYDIMHPSDKLPSLILFGEQPASIFYKINPKTSHHPSVKDVLNLIIEYRNLQDECETCLFNSIKSKLTQENMISYWYLIKDIVLSKTKFDLNSFAIYDKLKLINESELTAISNNIVSQHVKLKDRQPLLNVLQSIFVNIEKIIIDSEDHPSSQLSIDVAIPVLEYLHVVEYKYDKKVHIVGEPIKAELSIKTITKWWLEDEEVPVLASSSPSRNGSTKSSFPPHEEFQMSPQSDDNWLISGFKRYSFKPDTEKEAVLQMILIPLNVGKILLPKILIKSISGGNHSMEIDFKNGSETVLVVPEVNHITFSF